MFPRPPLTPEEQQREMMKQRLLDQEVSASQKAAELDHALAIAKAARRNEMEKIYLAYATAALQGLVAAGRNAGPDAVFSYAKDLTKAHTERFKAFWEKEGS